MFSHPPESNAQCQSKGPEEFRSKEVCLSRPHSVFLNIRNQRTCLVDITRDCSSALRFYNINLGKLGSEGRWPGCSRRKSVGSEVVHIKDWRVSRKQQDEGTAVMGTQRKLFIRKTA